MRTAVTTLAIVLGLVVVFAVFMNPGTPPQKTTPTPGNSATTQPSTPGTTAPFSREAPRSASTEPTTAPAAVAAATQPSIQYQSIPGLHVLPAPKAAQSAATLGKAAPKSPYKMAVKLTTWGAGVQNITLSDYREATNSPEDYILLHPLTAPQPKGKGKFNIYPFAARSVTVNGQHLALDAVRWVAGSVQNTSTSTSVTYHVVLGDGNDQPVLEIDRTYRLDHNSYSLTLEQHAINRSGQPLQIQWRQYIQGDLDLTEGNYLGDRRTSVAGYFDNSYDPSHTHIFSDEGYVSRNDLLKKKPIWPTSSAPKQAQLAWLGTMNRYFAIVTHPVMGANTTSTAQIPPLTRRFSQVGTLVAPNLDTYPNVAGEDRVVVHTVSTGTMALMPGGTANFSLGVYAGPRLSEVFSQKPYAALQLGQLVRYEEGCSWCTFQWLAKGLLWVLKAIQFVVRDWGVAIIILVLIIRLLLHPLTKHAQIGMMKMGKNMQDLKPELDKLKAKYKDDQSTLNREMMKLYREKGVNPASALGCLPMFLQTPIWIALYAMLYYAIELWHQPAFYGVFQWISGGHWHFLADLSQADHFYQFAGKGFTLNLIFIHPTFAAINLLPILMAGVFFLQQKYTTPPATSDQAAQQQKMMRFMTLLFPFFLYSAPSGLNLYILASTAAGVFDSYVVRKHVMAQDEAGELNKPEKTPKTNGFMARFNKAMQSKQREMEQKQRQQQKGNRATRRRGR